MSQETERILKPAEWKALFALDVPLGERVVNALMNEMKFPIPTIVFRGEAAQNCAASKKRHK